MTEKLTFWRALRDGFGSLLMLFPPPVELPHQTDAEALRSDWEVVGRDLAKAIEEVLTEVSNPKPTTEGTR